MKSISKRVIALIILSVILLSLVGCTNRQIIDTTHKFDRAIISMPDGTILAGKVDSWTDFSGQDQIQVKIDGTQYLVHSSNIVLIKE